MGETKNGPQYALFIKAKIVTPDITPSLDFADFGKVICGQRMTMYIRFENKTMVVAKWNLVMKTQLDSADPTAVYVDEF